MPAQLLTKQHVLLHELLQNTQDGLSEMELAIALSCSPKVVAQLIKDLRVDHKAPITLVGRSNLYHYAEAFELHHRVLGASDWQHIATVMNMLTELNERHESLGFKTIRHTLNGLLLEQGLQPDMVTNRVKVLGRQFKVINTHVVDVVSQGVFNRKRLFLKYVNLQRELSDRKVSPQRLVLYREQWYLDAWCHLRNAMRTFACSRINSAEILDAECREFEFDELDRHLSRQYGLMSSDSKLTATPIATVRFYNRAALQVSQQLWHPQAVGFWQGDYYEMEIPFIDDRELVSDLLALSPDVEVIEPVSLKEHLIERLNSALLRNH